MQQPSVNTGRSKRFVLHFDLNNTILMKDPAKGITSVNFNVARVVAKSAWGRVSQPQEDGKDPVWILAHDQLSWCKPTLPQQSIEEGDPPSDIISYADFLEQLHPRKDGEGNVNEQNKLLIEQKIASFTRPTNPGSKFKNHFEKMLKCLTLPKPAREELGLSDDLISVGKTTTGMSAEKVMSQPITEKNEDGEQEEEEEKTADQIAQGEMKKLLDELYGEGRYHIIPAFWRLLIFLKKSKKEFAIVFRTFGKDLENVIFEFNSFCNGEHPCFNGKNGVPLVKFDGTKNTKDMRIKEDAQKGLVFRDGADFRKSTLVTGSLVRAGPEEIITDYYYQQQQDDIVQIHQDTIDAYQHIIETLKKKPIMAIQDDYLNYKKGDHKSDHGKLFLIDEADYGTQHIFFDDNAEEYEKCIVDVRDVVTGRKLPYQKFINKYVVMAEPNRAIMEPDYFIKMIEMAEQKRDEEIERVESGIPEEEVSDPKKETQSEWEKLQKLPNEEYLMKTVLPVLYQGMKVVDLERPAAPLEYLCLYLLKHQDQIQLPPKPTQAK